jgi:hypothetical protein
MRSLSNIFFIVQHKVHKDFKKQIVDIYIQIVDIYGDLFRYLIFKLACNGFVEIWTNEGICIPSIAIICLQQAVPVGCH